MSFEEHIKETRTPAVPETRRRTRILRRAMKNGNDLAWHSSAQGDLGVDFLMGRAHTELNPALMDEAAIDVLDFVDGELQRALGEFPSNL